MTLNYWFSTILFIFLSPYHLQYLSEMISYQTILIGGIQHLNHGTIPIRMITHIKPNRIETTEITLAISLINISIFVKRGLLQRTVFLGLHTRYNLLEILLLDNQRQNFKPDRFNCDGFFSIRCSRHCCSLL